MAKKVITFVLCISLLAQYIGIGVIQQNAYAATTAVPVSTKLASLMAKKTPIPTKTPLPTLTPISIVDSTQAKAVPIQNVTIDNLSASIDSEKLVTINGKVSPGAEGKVSIRVFDPNGGYDNLTQAESKTDGNFSLTYFSTNKTTGIYKVQAIASGMLSYAETTFNYAPIQTNILTPAPTIIIPTPTVTPTLALAKPSSIQGVSANPNLTVSSLAVSSTSDNTDNYNNYIYPMAVNRHNVLPSSFSSAAPFSNKDMDEESISPVTGDLTVRKTDLYLKGKNGLDLSIARWYSPSNAFLSELEVYATSYNPIVYAERRKTNDFNQTFAGIGAGWEFEFPYIETRGDYKYLHLGSRGVYFIQQLISGTHAAYMPAYRGGDLDIDYCSGDDSFSYNTGVGIESTIFMLIDKDGRKMYFGGSSGRLLRIQDRFGNRINFLYSQRSVTVYSNDNTTAVTKTVVNISQITDSVGRVVSFEYDDTINRVRMTVSYPEDTSIKRMIYYNKKTSSNYERGILDNVVDAENNKTTYGYNISALSGVSVLSRTYLNVYLPQVVLSSITYPTGANTVYNTVISRRNCSSTGSMQFYQYNKVSYKGKGGNVLFYKDYTYRYQNSNEYDGYPTYPSGTDPSYTNQTYIKDSDNNSETYTYNGCYYHMIDILREGTDFKNGTSYKYYNDCYGNCYDLPTQVMTKIYNKTTANSITKVENYSYANHTMVPNMALLDMVGYWDSQSDLNADNTPLNDEHKTEYDFGTDTYYDNKYHLLKSRKYKKDTNTEIFEQYDFTTDKKNIEWAKVYERIYSNGTLQSSELNKLTKYLYDSYGNVSEEQQYLIDGKRYNYDSSGNVIQNQTYLNDINDVNKHISICYSYNDNDTVRMNYLSSIGDAVGFTGAYLTEKKVKGVSDADGQSLTSPGYSNAGDVAETYGYDWFGNVSWKKDGNGNVTSYQCDRLDRIIIQTNPDGTLKIWDYTTNTTENSVLVTDERGKRFKNIYDEFGNLLNEQDYATGENLKSYIYDDRSRLKTDSNINSSPNGSAITYTYKSDGRIDTKITKDKAGNVIASESYTYDDAFYDTATGSWYSKATKTIQGDTNSPSVVSSTYVNKHGQLIMQGRLHNGTEYRDTFKYDYLNNKTEEATARSYAEGWNTWTSKYAYNYAGKVVKRTDINNNNMITTYDALGRVTSVTDPKGNTTTYMYDNLGRLIKENIPFESTVNSVKKHYYDCNGNVVQEKLTKSKPADAEAYTQTDYGYNSRNMLTKVTIYDSGNAVNYTQFYYDAVGNKVRMYTGLNKPLTINGLDSIVTNGDSNYSTTKYEYNNILGKMTRMTEDSANPEIYVYDSNGNMVQKTDRNGNIILMTYDGLGRLLTNSVANDSTTSYNTSYFCDYYLTGNRKFMSGGVELLKNPSFTSSANNWTPYVYAQNGAVASGNRDTADYDSAPAGYRIDCTTKGTSSSDIQLFTTGIKVESGKQYRLRFKAKSAGGNITPDIKLMQALSPWTVYAAIANPTIGTSWTAYNLLFTSNVIDTNARITFFLGDKMVNGSKLYIDSLSFTEVSDTTYTYDDLGRLKTESSSGLVKNYNYDADNNCTSLIVTQGTNTKINNLYTYDTMNRLYQVFDNITAPNTAVATYGYDQNGNRSSLLYANGTEQDYYYNLSNKLVTLKLTNNSGTNTIWQCNYYYNLDSSMYSKTETIGGSLKTTNYTYDGLGRLTNETVVNGDMFSYTYDDYNNRSALTYSNASIGSNLYTTSYVYDNTNRLKTETKLLRDIYCELPIEYTTQAEKNA